MNGSAQNVGPRKKRSHATPAVAPVTRAIRVALAVSATALALSVPVVGLAAGAVQLRYGQQYARLQWRLQSELFSQSWPSRTRPSYRRST